MKINVTTTIEIDKDEESEFTAEELIKVYEEFRDIIKRAHESKDLTDFLFINADTNNEIENEVE